MSNLSLQDLLDVAIDAAYLGGRKTLGYFNLPLEPEIKADGTPVTRADKESEKAILSHIRKHFPDHDVLAEESGPQQAGTSKHRVRWIIDPLDGTKTFVRGVPMYGVLVAAEVDGRPAVGVCYLPALDEMLSAGSGLGCRWNGRTARVSSIDKLDEAAILLTDPAMTAARGPAFGKLASQCKFERAWGDCYGYVLVATGRAESMVDAKVNPWDIAALVPIINEAGGKLTTWKGEETIWGKDAFCSNGSLWPTVVQHLEQA